MTIPAGVSQQAIGSLKWTLAAETLSRFLPAITTIVLARLLGPSDFGLLAPALVTLSFVQVFIDAGLSKALVQTKEPASVAADAVFWMSTGLAILASSVVIAVAPAVCAAMSSPDSVWIVRLMAVQIVLVTLPTVQQSLMAKGIEFKRLFIIRLVGVVVPPLVAIPMAAVGFGVSALVAGTIAGQIANFIVTLWRSSWTPRLRFDLPVALQLTGFGGWILADGILAWTINWSDVGFIGRFQGQEVIGTYRAAWSLLIVIFGVGSGALLTALFPAFSRLESQPHRLQAAFRRANRLLVSVSLPLGVGLLLVGDDMVKAFFDSSWSGMAPIVATMGFTMGVNWTVGMNSVMYRAAGRPRLGTLVLATLAALAVPIYFYSAQAGLVPLLLARSIVGLVEVPLHILVCRAYLGFPTGYLWSDARSAILASTCMAGVLFAAELFLGSMMVIQQPLPRLLVLTSLGIASYGLVLKNSDPSFFPQVRTLLVQAFHRPLVTATSH